MAEAGSRGRCGQPALAELLVGRELDDSSDIARLWDEQSDQLPYGRSGIAVMAISGVDLALWDLGKAEGKRVCDLLGGQRRDDLRAYATGPTMWPRSGLRRIVLAGP